jgi:hypothetical protein
MGCPPAVWLAPEQQLLPPSELELLELFEQEQEVELEPEVEIENENEPEQEHEGWG